ncbi:hypothetical protein BYT27DRAFT_7198268 [Phlegmacium glaucopus]|nr:hypothetical protein BYT27DRAFT_7198268 [Phlegmacium glaucopus]
MSDGNSSMQNDGLDTQMNMNDGQTTYYFRNVRTVNVGSFNAHNVKTENSGNYAPHEGNRASFFHFSISLLSLCESVVSCYSVHRIGSESLIEQGLYPHAVVNGPTHTSFSLGYIVLFSCVAGLAAVSCLAVFMCPGQCLSRLCGIGWGKWTQSPSLPSHWQGANGCFEV